MVLLMGSERFGVLFRSTSYSIKSLCIDPAISWVYRVGSPPSNIVFRKGFVSSWEVKVSNTSLLTKSSHALGMTKPLIAFNFPLLVVLLIENQTLQKVAIQLLGCVGW